MAKNKIIFNGETWIDLTQDIVTEQDVAQGKTFHLPSGEIGTGTCTYDSDTSEDTATASEILAGKTAHARGVEIEGTMPNRGQQKIFITEKDEPVSIQQGYHDGSGSATIDPTEQQKLIPENIKAGIVVLGVTGNYNGESVTAQAKTATPRATAQTILPDVGYDYLSQVVVEAIPYTITPNAFGGDTVTIG